jgi:hypothetical protein
MSSTVNGINALSVRVRKPRVGSFHVDTELEGEVTLASPVKVDVDGYVFTCAVIRQGSFAGRTQAYLVGGAGGMAKKLPAQHYADIAPKTVILDILRLAGESLDSSSSIPTTKLPHWERSESAASHALVAICDRIGVSWRILDSGKVWVGTDQYVAAKTKAFTLDEDWETGALTLAAEEFAELAKVQPGASYDGHQIEQVTHLVTPNEVRTIASPDSLEGAASAFLRSIRAANDASNSYRCTVIAQNGDGTLQLKPDDPRIAGRGLDKVPIRYGAPGFVVKVSQGTIVHVHFDGGDWDKPYAALWGENGSGSVTSLEYKPSGVGSPVCRVGDTIELALPMMLPITTTLGPAVITVTTPIQAVITGPGNSKLLV